MMNDGQNNSQINNITLVVIKQCFFTTQNMDVLTLWNYSTKSWNLAWNMVALNKTYMQQM
jgi:hypothetical protein